MATRQEDLKTIQTMYDALSYQEQLKKRIEEEKEKIETQKSREIEDYPDYESSGFEKAALKEKKKTLEKKQAQVFWPFIIIFKLLAISFVIYRLASGTSALGSEDWGYTFWIVVFWAIPTLGAIGILCAPGDETQKTDKTSTSQDVPTLPIRLFLLLVVDILAGLVFLGIGTAGGESDLYSFWSETSFVGAVSAGCTLVFGGITYLILSTKTNKKAEQAIAEAKRKDAEHFAEYERNKTAGEIAIEQQRAALNVDVAAKIAVIKARIASYLQEIEKQQHIVAQTPGLAMEDKNLYTVSTILRYFERGKVDSIKEAINLFDAEERQKAASREAARAAAERNAALNSWIRTQRDALEEMEANQRRHNERVEAEARRAREEIEEALRR